MNNSNNNSNLSLNTSNPSDPPSRPPSILQVNSMSAAAAAAASGLMQRGNQYPSTGDQMDMQVLYELIGNLAEVQSGIREQTAGVLQRVQMIQAREAGNGGEHGEVNGITASSSTIVNGQSTAAAKEQAYLDEVASLRSQLSGTTTTLNTITTHQNSLQSLLAQHETTLSTLLTKLRPYATHHTQALESQKAHYLSLLETERNQNLDLRLEISRHQEGLGKVLSWVREAESEERGKERRWKRTVAGLKAENRVLRGVCGLPIETAKEEESSEESSEDDSVGLGMSVGMSHLAALGKGAGAKRGRDIVT